MIKAAEANGLGPESIDSIYLKGPEAVLEHEKRNGYDKEFGPGGVIRRTADGSSQNVIPETRQVVI